MVLINKQLEIDFYNNGIYDAWQFVINTKETLDTAEYCKDTILRLLDRTTENFDEWRESLLNSFFENQNDEKELVVQKDSLPTTLTSIVGKDIQVSFLLNKLIKDFFQYSRNVFDSISQIANASLLGNKAKKIDSVDFPAMLKKFNQQTYSKNFPYISNWYNSIEKDSKYKYIDAFNNRTKHTCDVGLKLRKGLFDSNYVSDINPFFRKSIQNDKKSINTYLDEIFDYVSNSFDTFMAELVKEYPKKLYFDNRYNKLYGYQAKLLDSPDSDFAFVYIETSTAMSAMPTEINVILLNQIDDGTIYGMNCNFNTILVKKQGTEHEYIGRYIAVDNQIDDTLLQYRKYLKQADGGDIALCNTYLEYKKNPFLLKTNPFIEFDTIGDDEKLIKRINIPL